MMVDILKLCIMVKSGINRNFEGKVCTNSISGVKVSS